MRSISLGDQEGSGSSATRKRHSALNTQIRAAPIRPNTARQNRRTIAVAMALTVHRSLPRAALHTRPHHPATAATRPMQLHWQPPRHQKAPRQALHRPTTSSPRRAHSPRHACGALEGPLSLHLHHTGPGQAQQRAHGFRGCSTSLRFPAPRQPFTGMHWHQMGLEKDREPKSTGGCVL